VSSSVMTKDKELAIAERREYDNASPEIRKSLRRGIYEFIRKVHPEVKAEGAKHRSRLLLAGDRADLLWERVEAGMPLSTAVRLLHEAEAAHVKVGKAGDIHDVIRAHLARYDSSGTVRRTSGGKVYRATQSKGRARRIAKGEARASAPRSPSKRGLKGATRDAIAAWLAARLPKDDDRAPQWVEECMREVEAVLDSFAQRFSWQTPKRARLYAACDLLNVSRPRWGQRADQERAWRNRRAALRSTHPDTLGHEGGREAFQGINDAYQDIVAYNDSLDLNPVMPLAPETTKEENGNGNGDKQ
jgi:hypothetical protein